MTTAPADKPALPAWAETVRRKYLGGETGMFVLYRNVFDEILYDGRQYDVIEFLSQVLLAGNKQHVIAYDPSEGLRAVGEDRTVAEPALRAMAEGGDPLAFIERRLSGGVHHAVIINYAGSVAPAGEENLLAQQDRMNAIRLHRWSQSQWLTGGDNIVFLLSESLAELNAKLVANPRIAAIEVPLPDAAERAAIIRHCDPDIDDPHVARLAEHSAGLRAVQIAQILRPRLDKGMDEAERRALVLSLLGDSANAAARADKLTAVTAGMEAQEIRNLINPEHPLPEHDDRDPYADVIELVHRRKREIIEKECAGLIEFVDARHGLDAVGGNEAIKAELLRVAEALKSGDRLRAPMGMLFVGPMGTGKTFVAKAFVKTSGLSAVTLKNFRSKWVGSTEANLEKVLGMVKALGPIILIIDEGDRSFGSQSEDGDGGTSSRVVARIKEFMSDTDNRGLVLFVLMTNRPDKLDIDIKRAGRLDVKIPFFYMDTREDVAAVLGALCRRYQLPIPEADLVASPVVEKLIGYSNADLEAVVLQALAVAQRDGVDAGWKHFEEAANDYLPSRDARMLEYMELLAVFECSRRSMLPAKYRDLPSVQLRDALAQIKRELHL
ncbi:ATP-binding protein [Agrilutibacter solisilvae]|uniref:ATP-binding protein n=1 Tax=Agrilutibacter solisilvae TaxID=2763317 RepID=A0A974Y223_9GAMM|nr:AAA family ATPase [Lysobacter solisilvae]QSX79874.1 ATP-binding protein [Lysobacter solisilvae]